MDNRLFAMVGLVLTALLLAGLHLYGQHQFSLGEAAEKARWVARDNAALRAANAEIAELNTQARVQERQHAEAVATISRQFQEQLHHVKSQKDSVIADLRAGAVRLRIPVTPASTSAACSGIPAEAFASAAGRDGGARAELSAEAAEFLVGLASEADEVVEQLTSCQALLRADRQVQQ
ncbi:lysis protein [Methylobacillus flagellatus]|nr:lysis protein [Methylobacillus flagellatus]